MIYYVDDIDDLDTNTGPQNETVYNSNEVEFVDGIIKLKGWLCARYNNKQYNFKYKRDL